MANSGRFGGFPSVFCQVGAGRFSVRSPGRFSLSNFANSGLFSVPLRRFYNPDRQKVGFSLGLLPIPGLFSVPLRRFYNPERIKWVAGGSSLTFV